MVTEARRRRSLDPSAISSRGLKTPTYADILERLESACDYSGWHWQPDTPPDYICISAILVQHTNWRNVERALERLEAANALSLDAIAWQSEDALAELVRPSGTPLVKARRLIALARLATDHGGLDRLLAEPHDELRSLLLATHGIGPETADAIVLYASGQPAFVIDAYTTRLCRRLGFGPERNTYDAWQRWFEAGLARDVEAYRRWHGLIVLHGKTTCRAKPRCGQCCLRDVCETRRNENA
jgi:endonuclease-3 related protein